MPPQNDTASDFVEPEDLMMIPETYRRIIARWLVQRGSIPTGGLFPQETQAHNDALRGAAVDLVDPLAEDSTIMHAREVLADLAGDRPGIDTAGDPTGVLHVGSAAYVAMKYYSAALDEIYSRRAASAKEALVRTEDLRLKSYPAGRRRAAEEAIERMTAAARGACVDGYPPDAVDRKAMLSAVGADECFTHHDWKQHVDRTEQRD